MAPSKMSKVFYGMSGSDASETQAKLVWYYNNLRGKPTKKKIIFRIHKAMELLERAIGTFKRTSVEGARPTLHGAKPT
ncbi:hypothetical protein LCM4579_24710 [Ensifer sp. LCM 4579]|nr:hypothetical protein LCM4579_24710 [Ensifer sp. LCM 4579]